MVWGSLEEQVLQQVGHARLAVILMPAAHQVGHVHRDGGFGWVWEKQHTQAVGQVVFGDALDGSDLDRRGQRGGWFGNGLDDSHFPDGAFGGSGGLSQARQARDQKG